jgi:hypothetical protein
VSSAVSEATSSTSSLPELATFTVSAPHTENDGAQSRN